MLQKLLFRQIFRNCHHKTYSSSFINQNVTSFYNRSSSNQFEHTLVKSLRSFHSTSIGAKQFVDVENEYIFNITQRIPLYPTNLTAIRNEEIHTAEDFNSTLNQNWRGSNASEILKAFKNLKQYCVESNISLSDTRFDQLVDGLMDHCEKFTDQELFQLLYCISEFPPCESFKSHNFHDIWSCLDDMCCWKMHSWDLNTQFAFAYIWYRLNLGKACDFTFELLDRYVKKADKLSKDQLVHIFFYFNICRKRPVDFEYEYALQNVIKLMNVDEMAVVALGYFKTQSKIKLDSILEPMIKAVVANSKTINEITLTAILKVVWFSKPIKLVAQMKQMLDKLYFETDRVSELCCLHISLMGTGLLFFHQKTLQKTTEKLVKSIANTGKVRLKDIERILNVLSMFNYDPKTEPDIFQAAYDELHKESRLEELIRYPRCLNSALNYLSLRNIYSYKLLDRVLDIDHIVTNYGKQAKALPQELFSLNTCIDIECPDYSGNRLPIQLNYKAAKWRMEWMPTQDQHKRITATEQLILDTIDTVKKIVKNDDLIYINHVLPHFPRADIILCKEKSTGNFTKPLGFENYVLGDIMRPFNDGTLEWYSIIVLGWNNTIRDTSLPLGSLVMKERQLRKIGYKPVMVIWNEFLKLPEPQRIKYILNKIV